MSANYINGDKQESCAFSKEKAEKIWVALNRTDVVFAFQFIFHFLQNRIILYIWKEIFCFPVFFLIKWLNWDENNWIEKFSLLVLSCCTYPYPCLMFTGYMTGVFLQHLMKCQQLFTVSTDWTCLQLNTKVLSTFVKQVGKTGSLNMCFCFVSFTCSPIILYWFF